MLLALKGKAFTRVALKYIVILLKSNIISFCKEEEMKSNVLSLTYKACNSLVLITFIQVPSIVGTLC